MSLFKMSSKGSYGIIPGEGHPKADDKIMNAGPGHVVPGENVHVAQRLLSDMGYNPEQEVDMNQGGNNGLKIKISSKEIFLNKDQVKELEDKGVNPELLSPNSQYNKTGNNMETGGPKAFSQGGLNLYELMMNNSNQYTPAYQNAGPTDPPGTPRFTGSQGSVTSSVPSGIAPGIQVPETPPSGTQSGIPSSNSNIEVTPVVNQDPGMTSSESSTTPQTMFQQDMDGNVIPDYMEPGNPNSMGENNQDINPTVTTTPTVPTGPTVTGINPEEQHINELLEKNKKSANREVLANMAMFGWNMSRERQPGEAPNMVHVREMVRDYEGMKGKATADLERGERRNAYMMKNLGAPEKIVGLHANTVQGTNQITQSIFDMQGQDTIQNINASNQAKSDYEQAMRQFRMNEAISSQNFKDMKGKNMAENVAQIFDVRENELNNEATLKGYKVNQQMDELDRQYNTLNKNAIGNSNYFSRQDWYKMTPEERAKWQKISDEKSKPKTVK